MAFDNDQEPAGKPVQDDADFAAGFGSVSASGNEAPEDQAGQKPEGDDGKNLSDAGSLETPPASAKAAEAPQDAPPAKSPGAFDPWAGMSPEQRSHWEKVQHSEQSQRGRIAALSRKVSAAPPPVAAEPHKQPEGDGKTQEDSASKAVERFNRIKAQAEEYPEVIGAIPEELADLKAQLEEIGNAIKPIRETQDAAQHTQAYIELEAKHPDFRDFIGNEAFVDWVEKQPQGIQKLVNSYDPSEVSSVLTLYKFEHSATMQQQDPGNGGAQRSATEAKRERQLDGSKAITSRGAPAASGVPDDFGAAFAARTDQLAKTSR